MDDIRQYLHGARDDDRSVLNFLAKVEYAAPMLFHPLWSWKFKKTSRGEFFSQRTQSGIMTTKKPRTCPMRLAVSSCGKNGCPYVLNNTVMRITAHMISIICHDVKA